MIGTKYKETLRTLEGRFPSLSLESGNICYFCLKPIDDERSLKWQIQDEIGTSLYYAHVNCLGEVERRIKTLI